MKNYDLKQSGAEVQELLDQVPVNKKEIERLKQLYAGLSKTDVEIVAALPSVGVANTIYRLTGSDGYADYMFDADDLSTAVLLATYGNGIDEEPVAGSENLVKSGGVFDEFIKSGVLDLSAYNNGTTYNNLSDALVAINNLPTAYKKGGMSIKYVRSYDNKYVQYRLTKNIWSTAVYDWKNVNEAVHNDIAEIAVNVKGIDTPFYISAPSSEIKLNVKLKAGITYKFVVIQDESSFYYYFRNGSTNILDNTITTGEYKTYTPETDINDLRIYVGSTASVGDAHLFLIDNNLNLGLLDVINKRVGSIVNTIVNVTVGENLSKSVPVNIVKGQSFSVAMSSLGGFWENDLIGILGAIDTENNKHILMNSIEYKNFKKEFLAEEDYKQIYIRRGSSALSDGVINLEIDFENFASKKSFDELVEYLGVSKSESFNVVEGTNFSGIANIEIAQGQYFVVEANIPRGLVSGNAYHIIAYTNAELTSSVPLFQGELDEVFSKDFVAETKYYAIGIAKYSAAIDSGQILFRVDSQRFSTTKNVYELEKYVTKITEKVGDKESRTINVTVGNQLDEQKSDIRIDIPRGKEFIVSGNIPRGLFPNNAYNIIGYTEESASYVTLYSGTLDEVFKKTFTHSAKLTGVALIRSVPALANGQIVLNVEYSDFVSKEELQIENASLVYVDAVNGSDQNDGTETHPFATFRKALKTSGKKTTIIFSGDTTETLYIKTKRDQEELTVIGKRGTLNRIIKGIKIDNASLVPGQTNVFSVSMESIPDTQPSYQMHQHEVADTTTLISDSERLPEEKGREYRCESTLITYAENLADVISNAGNGVYSFYFDEDNAILYFSCPNTELTNHPIYMPTRNGVEGNDGTCKVNFENFEVWYGCFSVSQCHNSVIADCGAKFGYGSGAFMYNNSLNITFLRCEAERVVGNGGYGDGFNGHSSYTSPNVRHTTCRIIDCWSHDNNDDGYSDHEGCSSTIIRGLYEYNHKAGVTPSTGAYSYAYDVISRNNYNGFMYVNAPINNDPYGSALFVNCVAMNNSQCGFIVRNNNKVVCVNCKSISNTTGYKCENASVMQLQDCGSYNDATIKSGTISITNTNIVS